jgi:hypothetical protein
MNIYLFKCFFYEIIHIYFFLLHTHIQISSFKEYKYLYIQIFMARYEKKIQGRGYVDSTKSDNEKSQMVLDPFSRILSGYCITDNHIVKDMDTRALYLSVEGLREALSDLLVDVTMEQAYTIAREVGMTSTEGSTGGPRIGVMTVKGILDYFRKQMDINHMSSQQPQRIQQEPQSEMNHQEPKRSSISKNLKEAKASDEGRRRGSASDESKNSNRGADKTLYTSASTNDINLSKPTSSHAPTKINLEIPRISNTVSTKTSLSTYLFYKL